MSSPNVVFIMTDQQRPDSIGHLGHEHARTPNLDRLAQRGLSLSNTYVQSTVCVPSRASILSGKYPHSHGAVNNGMWIDDEETNWVHDFRRAGYHTAAIGKIHSTPLHNPCGFEFRWVAENKNLGAGSSSPSETDDYEVMLRERGLRRPGANYQNEHDDWFERLGVAVWPLDEDLFYDNVVGSKAVNYLEQHDFDRPLMMHVGFPGPHDPFDVTESDLEAYGDTPIPQPVGYEGEFEDKPEAQREYMELMEGCWCAACIPLMSEGTREKIDRMRRHYFANVLTIDRQVGRICQKLEEEGELDNTIIVFTSDHGEPLGDHGMIYKFGNHYESVARVPCIVAGPGIPDREPEEGLVESIDLGPTLLDMCGIPSEQDFEACSVRSLIQDGEKVHDAVFSEYGQRLMIRQGDWKLVYYSNDDEGEMYDLEADPDELNNRYGDPAVSEERARLLARLLHWRLGEDN